MSEPQIWSHGSAETWSTYRAATSGGMTTFDLDSEATRVKQEKQTGEYGDGYGPPPGSEGMDPSSYVADPAAFYGMYGMGQPGAPTSFMDEHIKKDKQAIYAHPLYPLVALLFEKCELATSTPRETARDGSSSADVCSSASFQADVEAFVKHSRENAMDTLYVPNPQLDQMMLQSIQMLRFHLLELEKVHELCDNFCNRYVTCLKGKMPLDIVGDERASSSQPPMSPNMQHGPPGGPHSASPSMAGAQTPMSHFPPYEPQSVPLPENSGHSGVMGHSMEGSSMGYSMGGGMSSQPNSQDHPLANGGSLHTTAGASQTLPPIAVSSPSACSSAGGLRHESTPLSGETPVHHNANSVDSISEAGDEFSVCGSNEDGRESVLSEGPNGSLSGKRKVPKVFSKESITKFRAWLFQNLSHPYPSEEQKKQLAQETGLTILQVNNWFINARRRIVQPMIDQNNRAGRAPSMNVFKNRRRNKSEQSPGPSPDSDNGPGYSPDPSAVAAATAMQYPGGADLSYMQRTMFNSAYPSFANPAMPFMPQMGMMGFAPPGGQSLANPWVDPSFLSAPHLE